MTITIHIPDKATCPECKRVYTAEKMKQLCRMFPAEGTVYCEDCDIPLEQNVLLQE